MGKFKQILILFIPLLMLVACNGSNDRADAYGNFETVEVLVASEGTGKIMSFLPDEGEVLEKGQAVGYIDTLQLHLKKRQLLASRKGIASKTNNIVAQRDVLQAQLNTLLKEQQRIRGLLQDSAATPKQWDDVTGQINVVRRQIKSIDTQHAPVMSEIQAIDAQIEQIEDQISKNVIINPVSGTVLEKYAEPSEITSFGKPLYKVADLNNMILRVYISGDQLSALKLGEKVTVRTDALDGGTIQTEGLVTWIAPQAEFTPKIIQTKEERVNLVYAVKVTVKNTGQFKIGMPGEVYLAEQ